MKFFNCKFLLKLKSEKGQSLVELLVAMGLATLILPALVTGLAAGRGGRAQHEQRFQATTYVKEAQEAVRAIARRDWNLIAVNGTYHPVVSNGRFELSAGTQNINGYTISILISDVNRDSNGAIVTNGGNLDPSTKKVVTSVVWNTPYVSNVSNTAYFTRHKNLSYIDTTVANFNRGATNSATTGIAVTNSSGGEVTLGAGGGGGDWCSPSPIVASRDLPKNGVANAISAIEGKISVGTGENASGVSFANVDVSLTHPPLATVTATFDGHKTNGVFGETGFAYLATDTNSKEIVIMSLTEYSDPPTNQKYKEVGSFNAPGNGSGNAIYALGNYGYMASGDKFYIFDLSSKIGERSQVNSSALTLAGTAKKIEVVGNYAYVATDNMTNQLQIIDISDPVNPVVAGQRTVTGQKGKDLSVNSTGTRVYLATGTSASQNEFFIINTQDKANPVVVSGGTYDTSGMDPKGIAVVTGNRVVIVGSGGTNQYQVVNIDNENSPSNCGNLQVGTGVNGVSAVLQSNGYAYSYIITGDSTAELKIILGGAGAGSNHTLEGVYESATFDSTRSAAWNNILVTSNVPQSTTLQLRVAIKDAISNSCNAVSFNNGDFVGPDGQTSSYFPATGGALWFNDDGASYENPGVCAKYRAYLNTSDPSQTPVIYDVTLNYSP